MRTVTCNTCNKEFEHWQWKTKFCSKECYHKAEYKKYRKKYLDRGYQLQKAYGITLDDYTLMKETQEFKCKICFKPPNDPEILYVDHCHTTGKVRGLLCRKCNFLLGQANDSLEILQNAINYLNLADLKQIKEKQ